MSRDPKRPGEPPAAPETAPEKSDQPLPGKDPYGGVWAGGNPREDPSGQASAPRAPGAGGRPALPETSTTRAGPNEPHKPDDVYGGTWSSEGPREDPSGRGSAPRVPGAQPPEPRSFSKDGSKREPDEGPDIAADDAGASAKTQTPQRRPD